MNGEGGCARQAGVYSWPRLPPNPQSEPVRGGAEPLPTGAKGAVGHAPPTRRLGCPSTWCGGQLGEDQTLPESPLPTSGVRPSPTPGTGSGRLLPSGAAAGSCRFPRDRNALGSSSDTARTSPEARATLCTVEYAMAAHRRRRCRPQPEPEPQNARAAARDQTAHGRRRARDTVREAVRVEPLFPRSYRSHAPIYTKNCSSSARVEHRVPRVPPPHPFSSLSLRTPGLPASAPAPHKSLLSLQPKVLMLKPWASVLSRLPPFTGSHSVTS